MGSLALLRIGNGDFSQGFEVSLEIRKDNGSPLVQIEGRLPAQANIEGLYECWQQSFRAATALYQNSERSRRGNDEDWEDDESLPTNRSTNEGVDICRQWVQELEKNMQNWLQPSSDRNWQKIREKLLRELASNPGEVRLVIQAKETQLWKLPWHVWDLLEEYHNVGIGYSLPVERWEDSSNPTPKPKVRILAVLGDSQNINLQPDLETIRRLDDAETVVLPQPKARELIRKLRDKSGWDIFFFAGHSQTEGDTGRIYINDSESLEIDEFKNALQEAIYKGLKIAIFNSCDGLGLAQKLASLKLPVVIVMQEVVPDEVAQSFLSEFLTEYAKGQPLSTAVRRAQERLEEFRELPGATWLPVTFQNPAQVPPTWQDFLPPPEPQPSYNGWQRVLLATVMVTGLVMGVRWMGIFQLPELWVFDSMARMRPAEKPDERLLIVTVDEEDIAYQARLGMKKQGSLADLALVQLLEKLKPHQPAVIGLDIYRDPSTLDLDPDSAQKAARLRGERFIDICQVGGGVKKNSPEIPPPPGIPLERVGFSDLPKDPDLVVRRQIFGMSPGASDGCYTDKSFSFRIAHQYLTAKGIEFKRLSPNQYQIGSRVFPKLELHTGGYHNLDAGGFEVLLNYRSLDRDRTASIARQVPLTEILDGSRDSELPSLVRNRIVLIGTIDSSYGDDYHLTPYSAGVQPIQEIPGVEIQAQMVSQIISAVLDQRPILWWWPQWGDVLWVWGCSVMGGVLVWFSRTRAIYLILAGGTALLTLYGLCFVFLWLKGLWLPLVPSVLAVVLMRI
ncbi:MAG: CHASE2 domain-containing protein [Symploca sp. SIO1A3]|nr:CHASE2 domain-containing protein [Symploca sp. SIO1A3]